MKLTDTQFQLASVLTQKDINKKYSDINTEQIRWVITGYILFWNNLKKVLNDKQSKQRAKDRIKSKKKA